MVLPKQCFSNLGFFKMCDNPVPQGTILTSTKRQRLRAIAKFSKHDSVNAAQDGDSDPFYDYLTETFAQSSLTSYQTYARMTSIHNFLTSFSYQQLIDSVLSQNHLRWDEDTLDKNNFPHKIWKCIFPSCYTIGITSPHGRVTLILEWL